MNNLTSILRRQAIMFLCLTNKNKTLNKVNDHLFNKFKLI